MNDNLAIDGQALETQALNQRLIKETRNPMKVASLRGTLEWVTKPSIAIS